MQSGAGDVNVDCTRAPAGCDDEWRGLQHRERGHSVRWPDTGGWANGTTDKGTDGWICDGEMREGGRGRERRRRRERERERERERRETERVRERAREREKGEREREKEERERERGEREREREREIERLKGMHAYCTGLPPKAVLRCITRDIYD